MNFPPFRPVEYGGLQAGTFPSSTAKAISGRTSDTAFSELETNRTTSLQFQLTQDEWQQIIIHHEEKGTVLSFGFATETIPAAFTPTGYRWRYTEAPQVDDSKKDLFIVTCSFRADFYPSFRQGAATLPWFMRAIETAPAFVPTSPPPPPTVTVEGLAAGNTNRGLVDVAGLELGAGWEFSLNGGTNWTTGGQDPTFRLPEGSYAAGAIRVRGVNAAGPGTATQNASSITVNPSNSVTVAFSAGAGATVTGTVALPRLGELLSATSSSAGWLRLYSSAAAAAADSARPRTTQVGTAAGINADVIWPAAQRINFWPIYDVCNTETPATNTYQWRFTNDGTTGQIVVTFIYYAKIP